jgi:hypothetical protein
MALNLYDKDSNYWNSSDMDLFESLPQDDQDKLVDYWHSAHQRQDQGKELADKLADFVNGEDRFAVDGFISALTTRTHRTLQQNVFRLFCRCILAWSKLAEAGYDLRNEDTVEYSRKFAQVLDGALPRLI